MKSVTRLLFITTQLAALVWVSVSYLIAIYATVRLAQPSPVVELSQQAYYYHPGRKRSEGAGKYL